MPTEISPLGKVLVRTIPSMDELKKLNNLPNRLTIFRIFLTPLVLLPLYLMSLETPGLKPLEGVLSLTAALIFTLAALTDFLDGFLARRKKMTTLIGHFLDPIADKLLVVPTLILLGHLGRIPILLVLILVSRELFITSLRLLAQEQNLKVPVSSMGKAKTLLQMTALPFLMVNREIEGFPLDIIGTILIYGAALLSLFSGIAYCLGLFRSFRPLKEKENK